MVCHKIIQATDEHVSLIAPYVRTPDRDELLASTGCRPETALRSGLRFSSHAMTGFVDGEAVCMWGVVEESLIGNVGVPWMVGTSRLDQCAMTFLRYCRVPVMEMLQTYDNLFNYVDARNKKAIRWLRWLGFKIEDPRPYGVMNLPFHRFTMGR